jgi:astacin
LQLGIVAHEIAHALGYFHTQSRYDRDGFVTINLANVQSGYAHNFDKETPQTNNNYGYEYDLGSVMHYAAEDFAINTNIPVINSSDARYLRTMGNRREPSFIDVQMMNRHYSCLSEFFIYIIYILWQSKNDRTIRVGLFSI